MRRFEKLQDRFTAQQPVDSSNKDPVVASCVEYHRCLWLVAGACRAFPRDTIVRAGLYRRLHAASDAKTPNLSYSSPSSTFPSLLASLFRSMLSFLAREGYYTTRYRRVLSTKRAATSLIVLRRVVAFESVVAVARSRCSEVAKTTPHTTVYQHREDDPQVLIPLVPQRVREQGCVMRARTGAWRISKSESSVPS